MFVGSEADRLAIRELLDSYSDAVMRRDRDGWGSLWAEQAIWRFRNSEVSGRAAILEHWSRAMDGFENLWFAAFPGSIVVDGDSAEMRSNTFEYLMPKDGPPRLQAGVYLDRLIREDGRWVFVERHFTPRELKL